MVTFAGLSEKKKSAFLESIGKAVFSSLSKKKNPAALDETETMKPSFASVYEETWPAGLAQFFKTFAFFPRHSEKTC